jgi:quinol monooxygenase YgiN
MIIVQGFFRPKSGRRAEFMGHALDAMRVSRQEPGCLEYVIAIDPADTGRVVLSERWESKEAHAAHMAAYRERHEPPAWEYVQYEVPDAEEA